MPPVLKGFCGGAHRREGPRHAMAATIMRVVRSVGPNEKLTNLAKSEPTCQHKACLTSVPPHPSPPRFSRQNRHACLESATSTRLVKFQYDNGSQLREERESFVVLDQRTTALNESATTSSRRSCREPEKPVQFRALLPVHLASPRRAAGEYAPHAYTGQQIKMMATHMRDDRGLGQRITGMSVQLRRSGRRPSGPGTRGLGRIGT